MSNDELVGRLQARGVVVHRPEATIIEDVNPERFEPGVEIFPGAHVSGQSTLLGAGTQLGRSGGGTFRNVCTGRGVTLAGGTFQDAVFLDDVTVRGYAEIRGGTLMEEGSEAAHNVGYKMTIMLPFVVAGSSLNFCDALFAGGTSRSDHSEIGSCLALYNYTPWGDKFASLFGDVPQGVFLRSPRVFVGGQTQIVSPVTVGYGSVIPAGCAVRRSVPAGRLYGERMPPVDTAFDGSMYGGLVPKFSITATYIGNLRALALWYRRVRLPAARDAHELALYEAALGQVQAGIAERIKRLQKIVDKLPASREAHVAAQHEADDRTQGMHARRIAEHDALIDGWEAARTLLSMSIDPSTTATILSEIAVAMAEDGSWPSRLAALDDTLVARGVSALQSCVDRYQPWPT